MFTGISETIAPILDINDGTFRIQRVFDDTLTIGQSIAHDGACMTLTAIDDASRSFFAMQESLDKTILGTRQVGDLCNIERCVIAGQRMDGHFVTGHIDTIAQVSMINIMPDTSRTLWFTFGSERDIYTVKKGSISINGISLTIVDTAPGSCSVCLIPHTLSTTNLVYLTAGDIVNIEFDILAKYIYKQQQ